MGIKKVCFRADSSIQIGTGHIIRCLTLASVLHHKGYDVHFICRDLPGNINHIIAAKGFKLHVLMCLKTNATDSSSNRPDTLSNRPDTLSNRLDILDALSTIDILKNDPSPADLMIVDNYSLDISWESLIRPYVERLMVIDDIADRKHNCDILLDQNFYKNMNQRYKTLVPDNCCLLLGPRYALLRPEFYNTRQEKLFHDGTVKRVLIFFGGSDSHNLTGKVIDTVSNQSFTDITFDVVVGSSNPNKNSVKMQCENANNINYFCQVENMAELMAANDLAVCAGGTNTWERCSLGIPSLVIVTADNQMELALALDKINVIKLIAESPDVSINAISTALKQAVNNTKQLIQLSKNSLSLVDGLGTDRVTSFM